MITAALGLDISNFKKGVQDAKSTLNSFAAQATAFGGPVGNLFGSISQGFSLISKAATSTTGLALMGIGAAAAASGLAWNGMMNSIQNIKNLKIAAEQSGLTTRELLVLKSALGSVGIEADTIPAIMSALAAKITDAGNASSPAAAALARLGLSAQDLGTMSGLQQLRVISQALRSVQNDTERLSLAREILGKKGAMMLPGLTEGKLTKAETRTGGMATLIEQYGGVFNAFGATVSSLKVSLDPFFAGMATEIIPALNSVVSGMANVSGLLIDAGKTLGSIFRDAILGPVLGAIAQARGLKELEKFPTLPETQVTAEMPELQDAKTKPAISSLAAVGGAYGGSGTVVVDAQRENNRLTMVTNSLLQQILNNATGKERSLNDSGMVLG
jgi:hypothetical protein